jgi:glycosyltransferase involved in cell wall biosynthesis
MLFVFVAISVVWLVFLLLAAYHGSAIKRLPANPVHSSFPLISVVIAARDEEKTLSESLPKLIASSYQNAEFILVNDRSSDNTSGLLHFYAATDSRVKIIEITKLPTGWLGKVNAQSEGVKLAKGKWLLLTDADVHFEPDALALAVAEAECRVLDHLLLLPKMRVERSKFLVPLFNLCFGMMFVSRLKARYLERPESSAFGGVGAFNLVRRSVYDRSAGLEWLRLEVLDDVGVGLLMKRAGGRSGIYASAGEVHLEWYGSFADTIRGLEKNAFAGFARFSGLRATWMILFLLVVSFGGVAIALAMHSLILFCGYLLVFSILPALGILWAKSEQKIGFWIGLFIPIGFLLIAYVLARSSWKTLRQRGIYWRETFYSIDELRAGQRVKL